MSKEMVVSSNPHETRVAILEEGQLCEYYVEREKEFALVGSIYKGRVTRVLPGMQSAFVDIGLDSDAFLYVSDFLEDVEEFDPIVTTVEDKVQKMEDQGGQVFPAVGGAADGAAEPQDVTLSPVDSSLSSEEPVGEVSGHREDSPTPVATPSHTNLSPGHDHGRFENRSRERRDFGRRGGRRGGRGGGGHGGDRRYRELPPSKYASPRSYESHDTGSVPPDDNGLVILPGESLAKYKDKVIPPIQPAAAEEDRAIQAAGVAPEPVQEATETSYAPLGSSPTGLEPLPGEKLGNWQQDKQVVEEHSDSDAVPTIPEEHDEHEAVAAAALDQTEMVQEEQAAPELTEEEAATLAAHVLEAQVEEVERVERERALREAEETDDLEGSDTEETPAEIEGNGAVEDEALVGPQSEVESGTETATEAEEEITAQAAESESMEESSPKTGAVPIEEGSPAPDESEPPQEQKPSMARTRRDFRARMQHPARHGRDRGKRDDPGRRPQHGRGHHRPQPRRPQLIADLLKQGQEIIVQIAKEPLGKKGARITSHIALPGRHLVYMPTLDHTGVSRKISSAEDRARLRQIVNEAKGTAGGGFIVRTAAASATPDEIRADVEFLTRTWSDIKTRSDQRKAAALLHRDLNLVERILRDYITADYSAIWVDSEEEFTKVVDFMSRFQPQLVSRVKLYTKDTPVFEEFGIQQEIDKGLRPKVWLKSGGYIVINHTEALVAIDVNTGKFVGKGSTRLEDTIVRTNLEAVKEIVRQMRLRDLGGIIIIDFIDMEERRNRERVMGALEDALRADRAPSKVLRFNEFGLVAITRKRTKQALERTLCQPCPYCTGSGMVKSVPTLCYEIQSEARKMAPEIESGSITLRVHPEISKALKTRESSLIDELEQWTKKSVIIQGDPTLHWEQYDIY
jgi:ribonuclease G